MSIFYALSIVAIKVDPEGELRTGIHLTHQARVVSADSMAEAKELGRLVALEHWPASDGWSGHSASVAGFEIEAPAVGGETTERIM